VGALRLAKYAFGSPLALGSFALEIGGQLSPFDPIDFILMRTAIHEAGAMAIFFGQAGQAQRTLATRPAQHAVALAQAVVEFRLRVQRVILWPARPIPFAIGEKIPATQLAFAQMFHVSREVRATRMRTQDVVGRAASIGLIRRYFLDRPMPFLQERR